MSRPALRVDAQGERLRLLHVHAHPDDESSKGAATTAKYVAEGVDVVVATCTGGERGAILNPAMDRPDILANIADIRRQEMDRAREILGISRSGSASWTRAYPREMIRLRSPRVASLVPTLLRRLLPWSR